MPDRFTRRHPQTPTIPNASYRPLLRQIAASLLDERRVVRLPSSPAAPRPAVAALSALDDEALSRWLAAAIEALGPDSILAGARFRVVVAGRGHELAPVLAEGQLHAFVRDGDRATLVLDGRHWLVERLRAAAKPEDAAWLLLSCYAYLNDTLVPVTNDHEVTFQARVLDLLARGELRVSTAAAPPRPRP